MYIAEPWRSLTLRRAPVIARAKGEQFACGGVTLRVPVSLFENIFVFCSFQNTLTACDIQCAITILNDLNTKLYLDQGLAGAY